MNKKNISAWRDFIETEHFKAGIEHLRKVYCPSISTKGSQVELVESCLSHAAYLRALDDITEVLPLYPDKSETQQDDTLN
jgi:hypothetical protein